MITFLNVFRKVGGKFEVTDKGIRFWHHGRLSDRTPAGGAEG